MTRQEFNDLVICDRLISVIDDSTWFFHSVNNNTVNVYKERYTTFNGHDIYVDKLMFSVRDFLLYFNSTKTDGISKLMVKPGGKVAEPYSIINPNFHML